MKLYEELANRLREHIEHGFYKCGAKLPSVRQLAKEHGVSISTVQEAYRLLEMEQLVEAKPKSGYFVPAQSLDDRLPDTSRPPQRPIEVSQWEQVLRLLSNRPTNTRIQLQHAAPDVSKSTLKPLLKTLSELHRHQPEQGLGYGDIRGHIDLREQLSRLLVASGCQLHPDDLVITSGCQEALSVCLRAVTQPGDIVAIESPCFYGAMQAIKAANLKAIEIPTHPEQGISLEALELALDQWPIKAILATPTANNPLGFVMSEAKKKALYKLAQSYDIAIIEDDIYGDLTYEFPRPKAIKAFDQDGRVLLCSSVSKTVAPGMRVGWIAAGNYRDKVTHIKYVSSSMCPTLSQIALAKFISQGGYERHVRHMRELYKQNRDKIFSAIERYFPPQTLVTRPAGGFVLWVEFPNGVDIVELTEQAQVKGLAIAPGSLFSATGKYRNCCRLSYSDQSSELREEGIKLLGELIRDNYPQLYVEIDAASGTE